METIPLQVLKALQRDRLYIAITIAVLIKFL